MGRNKRGDVLRGVVLVPRLLTPEWFRRLSRVVDCFVVLPAGAGGWPLSCHEPLFIGLYLPLLRCSPWDWRRVPFLVAFARQVSALFKTDTEAGWNLLRQFWLSAIWIQNMPSVLVCDVLSDGHYRRFLGVAKKGSDNWTRGCG
jgi:hypothetical protein